MSGKKHSNSRFTIIGIATPDTKIEPVRVPSDGYSSRDVSPYTGDSYSSRDATPTSGESSRDATPTPGSCSDSKKKLSKKKSLTFEKDVIDYDSIYIDDQILKNFKEKYHVALKFVNNILANSELEKITDLTKFVDVDRKLIIAQKNEDMLNSMLEEIYYYFGKRECQFGQKDKTKHYIVTILKNMCKQLTLSLNKKSKNVQKEGRVNSYILYTISHS
jgi:hypothetical protein